MKLTKFQKNVLTFLGVGGGVYIVYKLIQLKNRPSLKPLKPEEKLIKFLYDYFSDPFQWGVALDDGAFIKPYVDKIQQLNNNQLMNAVNYYIQYYSAVSGEPTLSSWIDDQYYTLYIFNDPFASTITYLENKGL